MCIRDRYTGWWYKPHCPHVGIPLISQYVLGFVGCLRFFQLPKLSFIKARAAFPPRRHYLLGQHILGSLADCPLLCVLVSLNGLWCLKVRITCHSTDVRGQSYSPKKLLLSNFGLGQKYSTAKIIPRIYLYTPRIELFIKVKVWMINCFFNWRGKLFPSSHYGKSTAIGWNSY